MAEFDAGELRLPLRVYIEDTDAGGIVYYVNYLKFMERARTEFMRAGGFGRGAVGDDGLMFVVTAAQVRYHAPARLDDELLACARLAEVGGASLTFEQRVLRGDDVLASARVEIACVAAVGLRPRRLPAALRDALQLHVRPPDSLGRSA